MIKKIVAVFSLVVLSLGLAQPVSAAPTCWVGYTCWFTNSNYGGSSIMQWVSRDSAVCHNVSPAFNNNISSIYGNYVGTGRFVVYWDGANCPAGGGIFSSSGGAYPTLPASVNNRISSYMFGP